MSGVRISLSVPEGDNMENWKPYKYIYDISDYGRLRNRLTGKILKPRKNSSIPILRLPAI